MGLRRKGLGRTPWGVACVLVALACGKTTSDAPASGATGSGGAPVSQQTGGSGATETGGSGTGGNRPSSWLRSECSDAPSMADPVEDSARAVTMLAEALWGQEPDAVLSQRAPSVTVRGELYELALEMLADPRTAAGAGDFFPWWLTEQRSPKIYLPEEADGEFTQATYASMVEEARWFGTSALRPGTDRGYAYLLTAQAAYPGIDHGWVYDLKPTRDFAYAERPERFGAFSLPLFATTIEPTYGTQPGRRGTLIRRQLLCQQIPLPPVDLIWEWEGEGTMRQQWEANVLSNPPCQGCHILIGEMALGWEQLDAVGKFRTMDDGQIIDTTTPLFDFDGDNEFEHPREMMEFLASSGEAWECFGQKWFEFFFGWGERPIAEYLGPHQFDPAPPTGEPPIFEPRFVSDLVYPLVACAGESGDLSPSELVAHLVVSDVAQTSFACDPQRCLEGEGCQLLGSEEQPWAECRPPDELVPDCDQCDCSEDEYGNPTVDCRDSSSGMGGAGN